MLKKLLLRWGIAGKSASRTMDLRTSGKTASLASPEPSSCSSSETCSFSSASSYAENNGERRPKIRSRDVKKSEATGFACSSPISSSSSCGKQFREVQTQTDHCLSPLLHRKAAVCAYCASPAIPFCRNNQPQPPVTGSPCCPSFPVLPYLHPNQMSTCCFDSASGARMPATRLQFPLCGQSLALCYGPCLGPAPPPVHGHHLQPMTFPQPGCVVRQLDPLRTRSGGNGAALHSYT